MMIRHRTSQALAPLLLAATLAGCGFTAPRSGPGYAELPSPGEPDTKMTLSISLGPRVMQWLALAAGEDPGVRELVAQLQGLRIRQYAIHGDVGRVNQRLSEMSEEMTHQQWHPVIAVREPNESTYVLVKTDEEVIAGVVVLTSDGTEVVLVNAMGAIAPDVIAAAAADGQPVADDIGMAM